MRAALFFIAHAAASRLPNEAVVPLYDVPVVDPAGQLIIHEQGLRPHHSSGAASEDPLLFRHRYQHHDAATDRLLYYQYEAKRHPNVVMLTDMVDSCEASDGGGGDNVTDIKLAISVPMNMTNGTRWCRQLHLPRGRWHLLPVAQHPTRARAFFLHCVCC